MLILNLFLSVWIFLAPVSKSGLEVHTIDPIIAALGNGSSNDLAKFFDSSISLNINGQQGDYSKTQAELVLRDFFKKNPSQGFSILYQNENQGSISTYIGEYLSSPGNFKVFIKVSQIQSTYRIYSLDFVKN